MICVRKNKYPCFDTCTLRLTWFCCWRSRGRWPPWWSCGWSSSSRSARPSSSPPRDPPRWWSDGTPSAHPRPTPWPLPASRYLDLWPASERLCCQTSTRKKNQIHGCLYKNELYLNVYESNIFLVIFNYSLPWIGFLLLIHTCFENFRKSETFKFNYIIFSLNFLGNVFIKF